MFVQLCSIPSLLERYGTRGNTCRITGISEVTLDKYSTDVFMESHCVLNGKLMTHDRRSKTMVLPEDAPPPKRGRKKMQFQPPDPEQLKKRYCRNGHERTPESSYISPATGYIQCRVCRQEWAARKKANK